VRFPLLLLLCVALVSCRASAQGRPVGGQTPAERGKTSLQLIAEANQRGEIDDDQATLYGVYAVTDGEKLPPRYRGTAPMKDGTSALRSARARFPALRAETQELLRPYLFPAGNR
jgi:hypothetical protein